MNCFPFACLTVALVLAAVASTSANAQTCAVPQLWQPGTSSGQSISGTTCGGDTSASAYCAGLFPAPGPAFVAQATFTGNRTCTGIDLTGGPGYDAVVFMSLVSDGCGMNAPCVANGGGISCADIPDGVYYIIVTASSFDANGQCGTFTLSTNGTFPVELQSFSVG